MKKLYKDLKPIFLCFLLMTVLCGILYPAVVTAIAQVSFPTKANGSIIAILSKDGSIINYGSELIGQEFTETKYLIGRPLGASNLSTVGNEQSKRVEDRIAWWQAFDPNNKANIPMDLITASGSGVDPNISPESAEYQVNHIANARNISEKTVREVISKYTTGRLLGFWGEPAVNVLKVNLALDGLI